MIDADKTWVTSARHADSYVVATGAIGGTSPLETELYLVAADAPRDRDRRALRRPRPARQRLVRDPFAGVRVSADRRIGDAMGGLPLMLSQTLPAFTTACAGCCLGLAESALAHAAAHTSTARFEHLGDTALRDLPTIRQRLGVARVRVMETRGCSRPPRPGGGSRPDRDASVLGLKASGAEMAIAVTDEAMRVCGGAAYSRQLSLERCFRDARASAVMAPTSDVVREFLGRATTGLDLL